MDLAELKRGKGAILNKPTIVLIGPCGIETRYSHDYGSDQLRVLIGPCGIETFHNGVESGAYASVLIGPCGIETNLAELKETRNQCINWTLRN